MSGIINGKRAREYDRLNRHGKSGPYTQFILNNIRKKNLVICDLCCGSGFTIEILHQRVKQIDGIDASPEMIKICEEKFGRYENVNIKSGAAVDTQLKDNFYNLVILRMALHHLKEKQELLDEVKRILKQDGSVLLIDKFCVRTMAYHLKEIFRLIFKFKKDYLEHVVWSKDKTFNLIKKNFDLKILNIVDKKTHKETQNFMMVLKNKNMDHHLI